MASVGVSDHRLVNLYLYVWLGWCARRTQGFILIWAECPYVQFEAARVTDTCLQQGLQTGERGRRSKVSEGRIEWS